MTPTCDAARGGLWYAIKDIFCLNKICKAKIDSSNENLKSVTVEALDFDWVFEGNNTLLLLNMILENADDQIWDKKSI